MKKGWETRKLGEICNVVGGGTPSKDKPAFYSGQIPWATVRDMHQDVITETEFRITTDALKRSATNIIPSGNVIIATRVGLGKVCLLAQDTAINQDLRGIVPRNSNTLAVRYLYWWLKSVADIIVAEGTGATVQGVKLPFVKSLQIPVPPLAEQQRIVGILDEAFAGIAVAKANTEKNLQNARTIFESYLNAVFSQRGEGWVKKQLGDLCKVIAGQSPEGVFYNSNREGLPFYQGKKDFGEKFVNAPKTWTKKPTKIARKGDILISVRAPVGPINFSTGEICIGRGLAAIRCQEDLNPDFLFYQLLHLQPEIAGREGAVFASINKSEIEALPIVFSSVSEQQRIVDILDALSTETRRLETAYQRKLTALEELKKSLLHQAFEGNL